MRNWVLLAKAGIVGLLFLGCHTSTAAATGCPAPNGDVYSQAVLADNPIAYYRLDETSGTTMCDSSTSANNGTYNASGITYGVPGALASGDTAIAADGTTGVVGQSGSDAAGLTGNHDFTLEAWFKNTEASPYNNHVLVDIGQTCSDQVSGESCSGVTINGGQVAGLALYPHQNSQIGWGPAAAFGIDEQGSNYSWDATTVSVNLWDGNWHYLAVTYDHTTDQLTGYVDGQDLGAPDSDPYGNAPFNIAAAPIRSGDWFSTGSYNPPASGYFYPLIGGLDEVAVYGTAVSPARIAAHYAAASELTLAASTVGSGSVTSNPAGISCPGTCSADFAQGSQVTLTAVPASGSTFAGWSGDGCSGTGSCTVAMSSDQSVTATFNALPPGQHSLTVIKTGSGSGAVYSSPAGITCGSACSASFLAGTTVTLAAAPAAGSTFAGWSGGGCSGTGPCALTLSSDQIVAAVFTKPGAPPPALSGFGISPRKFALSGRRVKGRCVKATSKNRSDHRCTRPIKLTFSLQLSVAAKVTITIARLTPGRLVKRRCVKPTRKNGTHRRCTRAVPIRGSLSETGNQGANSLPFNGRIAGHRLGVGSYQLTATATANGQTSAPQTLLLKITG